MKTGVAINPHTPVQHLFDVLQDIDVVCMMSVNPGFGGQKFIPYTLEKIKQLKAEIQRRQLNTLIEIDGGVTLDNASIVGRCRCIGCRQYCVFISRPFGHHCRA